ncbi:dolichyl-diphosphooligosaccharide--protein glycotransferase subunit [Martiniozyma asiatica (nom. inval.)]|nr:dolichyl-diphosphooligosaccharide--protein glycotransferase subunit [Martiniozyma asiatica]
MLLLWLLCSVAVAVAAQWENTDYLRALDVTKSYLKDRHEITCKNIDSEPLSDYIIGFPSSINEDISLVLAMANSLQGKRSLLKSQKIKSDENTTYYNIKLPYPVAPGSEITMTISAIVTHQLYPYPEKANIDEEQILRLNTVRYPLSPYETTKYQLGFVGVLNFIDVTQSMKYSMVIQNEIEDRILFASEESIPPFSFEEFTFSFFKPGPLKHVYLLERDLWVSHWSNTLQLEEYYEMTNSGVQLKSGFNRAQWFNGRYSMKNYQAIEKILIPLPSKEITQDSMFFVDKVGNVSTSQIFDNELIIKPRFPIFGAWKYNFTIGWDHHLSDFLHSSDDNINVLQVKLLDGPFDTSYDKVRLSVYLPEGAEYIDFGLPFGDKAPSIESEFSYLDVAGGRVKVTFEFENLVDELKNFEVVIKYKYTTKDMLKKPLIISAYIFVVLFVGYILSSLNLSVSSKEPVEKVSEDAPLEKTSEFFEKASDEDTGKGSDKTIKKRKANK